MRIPTFIITMLLLLVPMSAQTYSVVKGSVYSVSTESVVIEFANTETNARTFSPGNVVQLTEPWGIGTTKDKSRVHLFFSNRMQAWIGGSTSFWLDNFEQFIDKDDKGKADIDIGSFVANFRFNGKGDFKVEKFSESSYFNILTNGADLNIKSTWFHVDTFKNITTIECYEGTITLTDSVTLKDTVLEAGHEATVFGRDGNMNTTITIVPLREGWKERALDRLKTEPLPKWTFLEGKPKTL